MPYEVEVTDQFAVWWASLTDKQQEDLAARVDFLGERGPTMRRPYSGEIVTSAFDPRMKELICDVEGAYLRVLYIFNPRQTAILLLGGDKKGRWRDWYDENVPLADVLYREHLKELNEEGLI